MSQLIYFVHFFYALQFPCSSIITPFGEAYPLSIPPLPCIIQSTMRPLFTFAHLLNLAQFNKHFPFLFVHVHSQYHPHHLPNLIVFITFHQLASYLVLVGIVIQPCKYITWSPSNLPFGFCLPIRFCFLSYDVRVLVVSFGFPSFASSFLWDTLDENMHHTKVGPWGWRMLKWFLGFFSIICAKAILPSSFFPLFPSFQRYTTSFD